MPLVDSWEVPGVDDSPWDNLYLGDFTIPGSIHVHVRWQKQLDVKMRRGRDGARVKDRGLQPHRVSIRIRVLPEEVAELSDVLQDLMPRRGDPRGPVTISHPATDLYNVTAIELETVEGPDVRDGIGEFSISAIEWIQKPKKKKKSVDTLADAFADYQVDVYGINDGFSFPNWQRVKSPWLSYEPPSSETDINAIAELGGTTFGIQATNPVSP